MTSRIDRRMITNYLEKLLEINKNTDRVPVILGDAEYTRVDDGNIQVRIPETVKGGGSRYFIIKVSEQI